MTSPTLTEQSPSINRVTIPPSMGWSHFQQYKHVLKLYLTNIQEIQIKLEKVPYK